MGIAPDGSPVDLYAEGLPELGEAELVHDAAGAGASILELGCGAGRLTRGLVRLGHGVVAVDESSEMLERLSGLTGVEAVCATIQDLRLDRVFDVVLLASNLINTAENDRRAAMLRTCRRHVADSGCVIIERMDPRWVEPAWAADKVAQPGHIGAVTVTSHGLVVDPPFMTETAEFTLPDGRSWRQGPFTSLILDDDALEIELRSADLCLERWLSWQGTERIWCTARPASATSSISKLAAEMARTYNFGPGARIVNAVFHAMTRLGLGDRYRYVLSVRGRTTGKVRSTPVDVMSANGRRWLVAAYGVTGWVRNARAAGEVTLSRGGRSETVRVVELGVDESVPVLRQYLREVPVTRPYFDANGDSPDEALAEEVARHPVFAVQPLAETSEEVDVVEKTAGGSSHRPDPRRPLIAGVIAGVTTLAVVLGLSLLVALLTDVAHSQNGCSATFVVEGTRCAPEQDSGAPSLGVRTVSTGGALLSQWNAVIWPAHGVPLAAGFTVTPTASSNPTTPPVTGVLDFRIPLGGMMLLIVVIASTSAGLATRRLRLDGRAERLTAALTATIAYTGALMLAAVAITARGGGVSLGPDWTGLLLVVPLLLGAGFIIGAMTGGRGRGGARRTLTVLNARSAGLLRPAIAGAVIALTIGAILGIIAMLVHRGDAATALANLEQLRASQRFPNGVMGTFATVSLVAAALPTVALWVVAYGLAVPVVRIPGSTASMPNHGLFITGHEGAYWAAVVVVPLGCAVAGALSARRGDHGRVRLIRGAAAGLGSAAFIAVTMAFAGIASINEDITEPSSGASSGTVQTVASLPVGPDYGDSVLMLAAVGPLTGVAGALLRDRRRGLLAGGDSAPARAVIGDISPSDDMSVTTHDLSDPQAVERLARELRTISEAQPWLLYLIAEPDVLRYATAIIDAIPVGSGVAGPPGAAWRRAPRYAIVGNAGVDHVLTLVESDSPLAVLALLPTDGTADVMIAALLRRELAIAAQSAAAMVLHDGRSTAMVLATRRGSPVDNP